MKEINIESEKIFHNKIFKTNQRKGLDEFYGFAKYIYTEFENAIKNNISSDSVVLEFGCGMKSIINDLGLKTKHRHAFDISDYAIQVNQKKYPETVYQVCDAHKLEYDDNFFDIIFGSSILHHLMLDKAIPELNRVIKPNGLLLFLEPLGHNYFINKFRNKTPEMRTEDEHPLLISDLKFISQNFNISKTKFYCLFPLAVNFVFKSKKVECLYGIAKKMDQILFSLLPFTRKYAWIVVIIGRKNKSH